MTPDEELAEAERQIDEILDLYGATFQYVETWVNGDLQSSEIVLVKRTRSEVSDGLESDGRS